MLYTFLYEFLYPFNAYWPPLKIFNVVGYLTFRTAYATITALLLGLVLGPCCSSMPAAAGRPVPNGRRCTGSARLPGAAGVRVRCTRLPDGWGRSADAGRAAQRPAADRDRRRRGRPLVAAADAVRPCAVDDRASVCRATPL